MSRRAPSRRHHLPTYSGTAIGLFFSCVLGAGCTKILNDSWRSVGARGWNVKDPVSAKASFEIGQSVESAGDYLRAHQYYERAIIFGMPEREVFPHLARAMIRARRYEETASRCRRYLMAEPGDRHARLLAATLFMALGRENEAEQDLKVLLQKDDGDTEVLLAAARLNRRRGRKSVADGYYARYLRVAPEGPDKEVVRFEADHPEADASADGVAGVQEGRP